MILSPYEIGLVCLLTILIMIMIKYYSSCSKYYVRKFRSFFFGFSSGVISLYPAVYIISHFGGNISINIFTLTVASILGIPGTILLAVASIV